MAFHRAKGKPGERGNIAVRETFTMIERDAQALGFGKQSHRAVKIDARASGAIGRWPFRGDWIGVIERFGHPTGAPSPRLQKGCDGDAAHPSGEGERNVQVANALPGADERLLRQIVGEGVATTGESPQETAHGGLVLAHQFAEGVPVVTGQYAGDQFRVAGGHSGNLDFRHCGTAADWRREGNQTGRPKESPLSACGRPACC